MKKTLKLSPYNPDQKLRRIMDGSRTVGTGFILVQYINGENLEEGIKIINAGSSLLPQDREFSAMEAECIALDRAMVSCHHWLYHCPEIELKTDCQGLIGWLSKHTADIKTGAYKRFLKERVTIRGNPNTSEEKTTELLTPYLDCVRKSVHTHSNMTGNYHAL